MGFLIFTESQTFNFADVGLKTGDVVTVLVVGSGAGGSKGFGTITTGTGGHSGGGGSGGTYTGGGGGGGGYGAGGGGGTGHGGVCGGGNGGGASAPMIKTLKISNTNVIITVGTRVPGDTNGLPSSFGNHITSIGGLINKGGVYTPTSGGGGGGAGGFQIGKFLNGGVAGNSGAYSKNGDSAPAGTGGGGGGGTGAITLGGLGSGGGGNGGGGINTSTSSGAGQDGRCFTGIAGGGLCLVWW